MKKMSHKVNNRLLSKAIHNLMLYIYGGPSLFIY